MCHLTATCYKLMADVNISGLANVSAGCMWNLHSTMYMYNRGWHKMICVFLVVIRFLAFIQCKCLSEVYMVLDDEILVQGEAGQLISEQG